MALRDYMNTSSSKGFESEGFIRRNKTLLIIIAIWYFFGDKLQKWFNDPNSANNQNKQSNEQAQEAIDGVVVDYSNTTITDSQAKGIANEILAAFNCGGIDCLDGTDQDRVFEALKITTFSEFDEANWVHGGGVDLQRYRDAHNNDKIADGDGYVYWIRSDSGVFMRWAQTGFSKDDIKLIYREFGAPAYAVSGSPMGVDEFTEFVGITDSDNQTLRGWIGEEMDNTFNKRLLTKLLDWAEV